MSPIKTSKYSWGGRGRGFKSRRSDQLRYFKALGVIRVLSNSSIFYYPIFSISGIARQEQVQLQMEIFMSSFC